MHDVIIIIIITVSNSLSTCVKIIRSLNHSLQPLLSSLWCIYQRTPNYWTVSVLSSSRQLVFHSRWWSENTVSQCGEVTLFTFMRSSWTLFGERCTTFFSLTPSGYFSHAVVLLAHKVREHVSWILTICMYVVLRILKLIAVTPRWRQAGEVD